jgi:D-alanyl-D-alanine dipeptidase
MIVVITETFQTSDAVLYRYQRPVERGEWGMVDYPVKAIVGKRGLGWGIGLHNLSQLEDPVKREGDGKSPAGIFHLDFAFGFTPPEEMDNLNIPYQHITEMVECIDDSNSEFYNSIVRRDQVDQVSWSSSERMWRARLWYDLGVFVGHNRSPAEKGAGSCIFLHYWANPQDSTSGCTAMDPLNMKEIVYWLDEKKQPVLVQLPKAIYEKYQIQWELPNLTLIDRNNSMNEILKKNSDQNSKSFDRPRTGKFRASGNEPGWVLDIEFPGDIQLQTNYGRDTLHFKTTEPIEDSNTGETIFQIKEGKPQVTIVIKKEPCTDTMSGENFEHRVSIQMDGEMWRGCGKYLN